MFNLIMENDYYCTAIADTEFTSTLFVRIESLIVNSGTVKADKILLDRFGSQSKLINKVDSFDIINKSIPMLKIEGKSQSKLVSSIDNKKVVIINLDVGDSLMIDNRNLLAFNSECDYSLKTIAEGFIGNEGLMICKLTAAKAGAQVAVIVEGSHYVVGDPAKIDARNLVGWLGNEPKFTKDISDSYAFEFDGSGNALIQPSKRDMEFGMNPTNNTSSSAISSIKDLDIDALINNM